MTQDSLIQDSLIDQRREAVAKLNEKPILALTLRLQWESPSLHPDFAPARLPSGHGLE